ncbi:MAG: hypothetical protein AAFX78_14705 [Cyanobacteria bacterium J06638_20]
MPAINLTELNAALGAHVRENPGIFVDMVYNELQTLQHVTVVETRDEMPITNIRTGKLLRPQKYDNAWNPGSDKVKMKPRMLKVRPAKFDLEFIPAAHWKTWLGYNRRAGSADQHYMPFEQWILMHLAKEVAEEIQLDIIWKGVHDPDGESPKDVCDGLEKIVEDSIAAAGEFDVPAAQVVDVGTITSANAYDQALQVARALPEKLRGRMTKAFMTWNVADSYNDDYTATIGAAPFNTDFNKARINGTNSEIVRTVGMSSGKILISEPTNLFVGMDLESDVNQITFEKNRRGLDVMFDCQIGVQVADPRNIAYGYDATP